jgi:hypothetical protein
MDENVSLKQLIDELTSVAEEEHVGRGAPIVREKLEPIGSVLDIAGSGAQARLDPTAPMSRSAPFTRPTTFAARFTSTRC